MLGSGAAFIYTPAADYDGADSFTFSVSDGVFTSNIATIDLTVATVDDAPTITGQGALSTIEDTAITIGLGDLVVTDPDNSYPTGFTLSCSTAPTTPTAAAPSRPRRTSTAP